MDFTTLSTITVVVFLMALLEWCMTSRQAGL